MIQEDGRGAIKCSSELVTRGNYGEAFDTNGQSGLPAPLERKKSSQILGEIAGSSGR